MLYCPFLLCGLMSFIFISSLTLLLFLWRSHMEKNSCVIGIPRIFDYFSFWNVVYFDHPILSINLRGYNFAIVEFFCTVFVTSFNIITIIFFVSVSIVMGIPTVKREVKSYLIETLHSLIDNLYPEEKLDCVIVVFIGEVIICYIYIFTTYNL